MAKITASYISYYGTTEFTGGPAIVGTSLNGNSQQHCVTRYTFKTDAYGATKITFQTAKAVCDVAGTSESYDSIANIRFQINRNATNYINYQGNNGYGYPANLSYVYGSYIKGTLTANLLPNTTYYIWVFPNSSFAGYTRFNLGAATVTTSGTYGQPSSVTAENGTFGTEIPITVTPQLSGVTHTVTTSCGGIEETIAENSAETAFTWTPAIADYAAAIPDAMSAVATITCQTLYNGVDWGSKSKTIIVSFAENDVKPTLSSGDLAALSIYNTGSAAAGINAYVQGYSKLQVAFQTAQIVLGPGASVANYSFSIVEIASGVVANTLETVTGETATLLSNTLPVGGTYSVVCTMTDSRGLTLTATYADAVTVLTYSKPYINYGARVYRTDSNNEPTDSGTKVAVQPPTGKTAIATYSSLNGANSITVYFDIRTLSQTFPQNPGTVANSGAFQVATINADPTYEAALYAVDSLGNRSETYLITVPGQGWAIKFTVSAGAVVAAGVGKAPETTQVLEIPSAWSVKRSSAHAIFTDDTEWTGEQTALSALQGKTEYLPAGLKIQYGTAVTDANGLATVTFDTAFTATPIVLVDLQGNSTNIFDARPYDIATTGFSITVRRYNGSSISATAVTTHWIAIGV